MNTNNILQHPVQKHIVSVLTHNASARFKQLRPNGIDTNLVTYHLKKLIQEGYIVKIDKIYTLAENGIAYVDRQRPQSSPRVVSMLLIQNSDGEVLLRQHSSQPYINTWTLPYRDIEADNFSMMEAGNETAKHQLGISEIELKHIGDCYVRVLADDTVLTASFVHVMRGAADAVRDDDNVCWVAPRSLVNYNLAPCIDQIIARAFFGDEYFFAEFEQAWSPSM